MKLSFVGSRMDRHELASPSRMDRHDDFLDGELASLCRDTNLHPSTPRLEMWARTWG